MLLCKVNETIQQSFSFYSGFNGSDEDPQVHPDYCYNIQVPYVPFFSITDLDFVTYLRHYLLIDGCSVSYIYSSEVIWSICLPAQWFISHKTAAAGVVL